MKRLIGPVALAFAMVAAGAWGAGPTEREIEEQLLAPLLVQDIARIRMAGLGTGNDHPRVSDLAMEDESMWEPGRFEVRFRVYFVATDDLYEQVPPSQFRNVTFRHEGEEDDEYVYVLVGRKGEKFSIQYQLETERKGGQWVFAKKPYAGTFEWPEDATWDVRTRGCWEEWGRQMGKPVVFYDSERAVKDALRNR